MIEVAGFTHEELTLLDRTKTVYTRGEGPPIIVMHEIPGITPKVAAFARRLADEGFTVVMPLMFGTPNRPFGIPYMLQQQVRACVSSEFSLLATHRASPITEWLRALSRKLHEEHGTNVGAIGMCLTGNFALSLMLDPWLMAPVLSQPSLPLGLTRNMRRALHVTDEERAAIIARDIPVLGMRFTHDRLCPRERFEVLRETLGDRFEHIEIDSSPNNPHGNRRVAHSVLTEDFVDREGHPTHDALLRTLAFFREHLRPE
jgi:dienelactone hydrolase